MRSIARHPPKSQREFAIQILTDSPQAWMRSSDIVEQARKRFNVRLSETSLRPLLSVMKREGVIARDGRWIALSQRAFEKERTLP